MEKRKLFSLIAILLIVVMLFGLFYTNAKYTSTVSGKATASVAKYVFNVTGSDSYGGTDIKALTLAQSVDEKTLVNGKIAPGTSGSMDIVLDATGSEVGIAYEVSFENTSEHALPTNLILTLDGENWDFDEKITGIIDANASNKTVSRTILWSWPYETADSKGDITAGDIADTIDGKNAFDYSFTVTATGTQVNPLTGVAPTVHTHQYKNLIGKTIVDNKVYCSDDCDGIDVTVVTEGKTVEINGVTYNVSNNVIQSKYEKPNYAANAFVTEWTLTENNTTVTLPITEIPSITVDWGDGTVEKITSKKPTHTYTSAGTYDINITGNLPAWHFNTSYTSKDYITGIKFLGDVQITNLAFVSCKNLTSIPEDLFSNCYNVTNFSSIFDSCTSLTSIPENLFANCPNATNFSHAFDGCTGLTSIPENLFANCSNVTDFSGTFTGCMGLTSIPENLFANCPNVTDFSTVFNRCTGLTSIPENLFANYSNVTDFSNAFNGCTGLTSININTSSIGDRMFLGCTNLKDITIGNNVKSIGESAFKITNKTQTTVTTNNKVAKNYDWSSDNRTVTFKSL